MPSHNIIIIKLCIARAVIIDAVSQPQAMKKMLEKDFGKVFGLFANASMLVRALKSMGAFKVKM